jgi:hypothetical protein
MQNEYTPAIRTFKMAILKAKVMATQQIKERKST